MIITNYKEFINENLSDFDFKGIFLELTEYTIPYGYVDKTICGCGLSTVARWLRNFDINLFDL
jgi:hypothetical protein